MLYQLADTYFISFSISGSCCFTLCFFRRSCSNLGDAQARRLKIRVQGEDGTKYLAHTLNNTVVAPPRMLIAFLENNLQADGSVRIPEVLRPYMGGMEAMVPKNNK